MLRKIIDTIDVSKISHAVNAKDVVATNKDLLSSQKDSSSSVITHEWLWPTVGNFFRPKDIIVTETGLSSSNLGNWKELLILESSTVGFRRM